MYTLIIPTRNRSAYLARLLGYYARCRLRAPIVIADGSDGRHAAAVSAVAGSMASQLGVQYVAYGESVPLFERFRRAARTVDTPCVAWVADDDFLIPEALEKGSELLSRRPDVSAVVGKAMTFSIDREGVAGKIHGLGNYEQRQRSEDDPARRLLLHAQHYSTTVYALRRTSDLQRVLDRLDPERWKDENYGFFFIEYLDSFLTLLRGKIAKVDNLMMLRQTHAAMTSFSTRRNQSAFDLLLHPDWHEYSKWLLEILAAACEEEAGMDSETAGRTALLVLWMLVSRRLGARLQAELVQQGLAAESKRGTARVAAALDGFPALQKTARKMMHALRRRRLFTGAGDNARFELVRNAIEGDAAAGA